MSLWGAAQQRAVAASEWLKVNKLPEWWRRRDKSAERAAVASRAPIFLSHLWTFLAGMAWFLEFGFAGLWAIRANGELDWTWETAAQGSGWSFLFSAHMIPAGLTTLAVAVIVAVSVTWIPTYHALNGFGRARRGSILVIGPLCTAIAILGALVSQADNMALDARDATVVQQQAGASRASIERQINRRAEQLARMRDRTQTNEYAALAATIGAERYREGYASPAVLAAEPDPSRRRLLERALTAAGTADDLEQEIDALEAQLADAPVDAELAQTAREIESQNVASIIQVANDNRILLLAFTLSLIGLVGAWIAQGLHEATVLLDPLAPQRERQEPATAPENANTGASDDTPPVDDDTLALPPLPAPFDDPAFAETNVTVDDQGRRLRRVAGSFRAERDAPRSQSDARRPPADDGPQAPDAPPSADGPADPADDADDPLAAILKETAAKAAAAAQARENASAK